MVFEYECILDKPYIRNLYFSCVFVYIEAEFTIDAGYCSPAVVKRPDSRSR